MFIFGKKRSKKTFLGKKKKKKNTVQKNCLFFFITTAQYKPVCKPEHPYIFIIYIIYTTLSLFLRFSSLSFQLSYSASSASSSVLMSSSFALVETLSCCRAAPTPMMAPPSLGGISPPAEGGAVALFSCSIIRSISLRLSSALLRASDSACEKIR